MSKRFIDNEIFKKKLLRGLEAPLKLLWVYLFCECSTAGIWEYEPEIAEIRIGQKIDWKNAIEKLKNEIVFLDGGSKIFIPAFINFQYGELSATNPAHKGVIRDLLKFNLLDENLKLLESPSGVPTIGTMDMDKEKDMVMDKEKPPKKIEKKSLSFDFIPESDPFQEAFIRWVEYRKELGKPFKLQKSLEAAFLELKKISENDPKTALEVVNRSIGNQWQGLFSINHNGTGTGSGLRTGNSGGIRTPNGKQHMGRQDERLRMPTKEDYEAGGHLGARLAEHRLAKDSGDH